MIDVSFSTGNYVVKNDNNVIIFTNDVYSALKAAYKESNGNPFTVSCPIPNYDESTILVAYHCPKCSNPVKLYGSLNTSDSEDNTKDDYVFCNYCNQKYTVSWLLQGY